MPLTRRPLRARGFSLLEVLLALVVLSVGLLGAAAMLLDSLRTPRRRVASDRRHAARARHGRPHSRQSARACALRLAQRGAPVVMDCAEPSGCDATQLAALDRAHFASAARALFAHQDFTASVEFAPAIGPAAPDRYVISLRWRDARDATDDTDAVALQVLAQLPVAG